MKQTFSSTLLWLLLCLLGSGLLSLRMGGKSSAAQSSSVAQAMTLTVLNVRSGPGTQYPILGKLAIGSTVQVTGRTPDKSPLWWQIVYPVGSTKRGWISGRSEYVRVSNTAQVPVVDLSPQSPTPTTGSAAPQILSFTVTPTTTQNLGDPMNLVWTASGDRAELCRLVITQLNCEAVPLQGQKTLIADQNLLGVSAFVLQAFVGTQKRQNAVYIHLQCQNRYAWFFANPPVACPASATFVSQAAFQRFEHGMMLWVETGDMFYVFFDEQNTQTSLNRTYITLWAPYVSKEGASPDNRTGETPPPGLFEPVSGFGQLWRDEFVAPSFYFHDLRARLGWAVAVEEGYEFAKQCEANTHLTCYLRLPGDRVLVTRPDSTVGVNQLWTEWLGN